MKRLTVVLPAMLLIVAIPVANAADTGMWTLGPNLGFGVVSASGGGGSVTSVGIPSGGGQLFGSFQPGMRVGYIPAGGQYDVFLDVAANYASSSGDNVHTTLATLNFQFNFSPEATATPYATGGLGLSSIGGTSFSTETDVLFGFGLGVRRQVSEGHGALRAEGRYDRVVIGGGAPGLNSFGLKLGVDLWIP